MPAIATPLPSHGRVIAFGAFTFDRVSRLLRRDGVELPLPPRVLGVLELLVEQPGEVVTKQALISAVWRDAFVTETSIAEAISVLRQTLGDDPQRPAYVQTLHRRGYRFIAEVQDVDAVARPSPAALTTADSVPSGRGQAVASPAPDDERPPRLSLLVPWLVTLFALLTAAAAVWRYVDTTAPPALSPVRFVVALPAGVTVSAEGMPAAVSDDGGTVAFSGCDGSRCTLYLRPLSQPDATPMAGTTGASSPFFSPDGRSLGFVAGGMLRTMALGGGAAVDVAPVSAALGAAWLPDGRIVFARSEGEGLFIVAAAGGGVRGLTTPQPGEGGHRWPAALADGSGVVFTVADPSRPRERYGAVARLATGAWSRLLDDVGAVAMPTSDHLAGQRGDGLVAGWLDARTHAVVGLPAAVPSPPLAVDGPGYAVSRAGTLVTVAPSRDALHVVLHWDGELRRLVPPPPPSLPR